LVLVEWGHFGLWLRGETVGLKSLIVECTETKISSSLEDSLNQYLANTSTVLDSQDGFQSET
jgi:hypothetical protein